MAGEMPPPMPPAGEFSAEDYEFEDFDELEPGNAMLDEVLTRVGEFALDTIEAVQAHPIVAASLVAAALGGLAGVAVAAVAPRRRRAPVQEVTAAAAVDT